MGEKHVDNRFLIPAVIDPPKACLTMEIPNDPIHIANVLGALAALIRGMSWADDDAHSAKQLIEVWRRYYLTIRISDCDTGETILGVGGCDDDCMCCLRWNNGVLEQLVCGTWTAIPGGPTGGVQNPTQPGTDQGGRPTPGSNAEQCYHLDANGVLLLPFQVYPGDTLEITSAEGAGSDAVGIANWFCPDGTPFVFGVCTGFGGPLGGDPLPGVDHMRLIYNIGGTYVDAMGGAVVVGGSGPQSVGIQVNDATITDNPGSYKVCVKLTNGQVGTWSHTFDFSIESGGWIQQTASVIGTAGVWTPGTGWQNQDFQFPAANYYRGIYIHRTITSTPISSISIVYDMVNHGAPPLPSDDALELFTNPGSVMFDHVLFTAMVDGAGQTAGGSQLSPVAATDISLFLVSSYATSATFQGSCVIRSVTISGTGTDPF